MVDGQIQMNEVAMETVEALAGEVRKLRTLHEKKNHELRETVIAYAERLRALEITIGQVHRSVQKICSTQEALLAALRSFNEKTR